MLSYASNSNQRLPTGPWAKVWLTTAVLVVLGVVAVESFWRSRGFHPVLTDDAGLWALARGHVQKDNPHRIVLVGSSRIHLGVDVGTLAESFPDWPRPVQLAIHGSNCLPVLQQLSRDEHFVGIAIVEVKPWSFYAGISLGGPRDATGRLARLCAGL